MLSQNICQGLGLNLGHPKTLGLASCALAPDHQHPQHPTMGPCDGGYAWMMIYKCSNGKNLIELVMSETSMDNMVHALRLDLTQTSLSPSSTSASTLPSPTATSNAGTTLPPTRPVSNGHDFNCSKLTDSYGLCWTKRHKIVKFFCAQ